jgi:hypothetical protein
MLADSSTAVRLPPTTSTFFPLKFYPLLYDPLWVILPLKFFRLSISGMYGELNTPVAIIKH